MTWDLPNSTFAPPKSTATTAGLTMLGEKLAASVWRNYAPQMAGGFRKLICISEEESRFETEGYLLERIPWKDIGTIKNMGDYDCVLINLTALAQVKPRLFERDDILRVFDPKTWAQIFLCGGSIVVIGAPQTEITTWSSAEEAKRDAIAKNSEEERKRLQPPSDQVHRRQLSGSAGTSKRSCIPMQYLFDFGVDSRLLDFRRVNMKGVAETATKYLEMVDGYDQSLNKWEMAAGFRHIVCGLQKLSPRPVPYGITSFDTVLAIRSFFITEVGQTAGTFTLLPSSHKSVEWEDLFVLQEYFGVSTGLAAPDWVNVLTIPGQKEIEDEIQRKSEDLGRLQVEINQANVNLNECKRWYGLLYDDGNSLEGIVKEAFELLGATVEKVSPVKDDFRISVAGFAEGVMEVKGTHNIKFQVGPVRQLAGWLDLVIAEEEGAFKGIFVGNSGRKDEPSTRGQLFDHNGVKLAVARDIVILRSVDLLCLVILKQIQALDVVGFWKKLFECKGQFDATEYWNIVPPEFQITKPTKA